MESEALYIAVLIVPWVFVLAALFFYRRRRMRKALEDSKNSQDKRVDTD